MECQMTPETRAYWKGLLEDAAKAETNKEVLGYIESLRWFAWRACNGKNPSRPEVKMPCFNCETEETFVWVNTKADGTHWRCKTCGCEKED